jgi:hypothetical protein
MFRTIDAFIELFFAGVCMARQPSLTDGEGVAWGPTIFEHVDGKGRKHFLLEDSVPVSSVTSAGTKTEIFELNLEQLRLQNDSISSVDPSDCEITFFEHRDFQGKSLVIVFGSGRVNLTSFSFPGGGTWNDKVSSIRLRRIRPEHAF